MASIDNSPVKRIIIADSSNKLSIDNSPVMKIVYVDAQGQPIYGT